MLVRNHHFCSTVISTPNQVLIDTADILIPTASITNLLPILDLIPGPMPWRTRVRNFREKEDAIYDKLINHAMRLHSSGIYTYVYLTLLRLNGAILVMA